MNKPISLYLPVASLGPPAPHPGWCLEHYPAGDAPTTSLPKSRSRAQWLGAETEGQWVDAEGQEHRAGYHGPR